MHALAGQRVQIGREGRDQRLALARLHLGNVTLMQEDTAHELHVEGPQAKRPLGGLAAVGKGFGKQVVQAFALHRPRRQLFGLVLELVVGEGFELCLEIVDLLHEGPCRLDFPVVRRAEDLFGESTHSQHDAIRSAIDVDVLAGVLVPPRHSP